MCEVSTRKTIEGSTIHHVARLCQGLVGEMDKLLTSTGDLKMKRMKWSWIAALALMTSPALAAAGGNVNLFLGGKTLDNDWAPFDEHGEFGILIDVGDEYWPVNFAIDLLGSSKQIDYWDGYTYTSTSEIDIGARKVFDIYGTTLHPYAGGGLALVSARIEDAYYNWDPVCGYLCADEDTGLGIWLNGGIYMTLGQSFNLGLDLRYSQADVTLGGATVDAGGTHAGILLGYHW